jgi:transposase
VATRLHAALPDRHGGLRRRTHHLSRKLTSLGHDARLMPAKYVRPYLRGRRTTSAMPRRSSRRCRLNDGVRRDKDRRATRLANAPACGAVGQLGTGIINEIRGFLLEPGIAVRQGLRFLRAAVRSPMIARGAAPADLAGAWRCAPGALKPPLTLWAIRREHGRSIPFPELPHVGKLSLRHGRTVIPSD